MHKNCLGRHVVKVDFIASVRDLITAKLADDRGHPDDRRIAPP
jgi:hypothetical protein